MSLLPQHENIRRAIKWLAEEERHDASAIEEAARLFDLSPVDEEFLLNYYVQKTEPCTSTPGDE